MLSNDILCIYNTNKHYLHIIWKNDSQNDHLKMFVVELQWCVAWGDVTCKNPVNSCKGQYFWASTFKPSGSTDIEVHKYQYDNCCTGLFGVDFLTQAVLILDAIIYFIISLCYKTYFPQIFVIQHQDHMSSLTKERS